MFPHFLKWIVIPVIPFFIYYRGVKSGTARTHLFGLDPSASRTRNLIRSQLNKILLKLTKLSEGKHHKKFFGRGTTERHEIFCRVSSLVCKFSFTLSISSHDRYSSQLKWKGIL